MLNIQATLQIIAGEPITVDIKKAHTMHNVHALSMPFGLVLVKPSRFTRAHFTFNPSMDK